MISSYLMPGLGRSLQGQQGSRRAYENLVWLLADRKSKCPPNRALRRQRYLDRFQKIGSSINATGFSPSSCTCDLRERKLSLHQRLASG